MICYVPRYSIELLNEVVNWENDQMDLYVGQVKALEMQN